MVTENEVKKIFAAKKRQVLPTRQHEKIELLIRLDLLLKMKNKSFHEKNCWKKSTIQRRSLSASDKSGEKTMKLLAKMLSSSNKKRPWRHFQNSSREATEIQFLTNLAFKINWIPSWIANLMFHSTKLKYLAIQISGCFTEKSISLPITSS